MATRSIFESSSEAASVLNSWKEIAVYMGRGVHTLQKV